MNFSAIFQVDSASKFEKKGGKPSVESLPVGVRLPGFVSYVLTMPAVARA